MYSWQLEFFSSKLLQIPIHFRLFITLDICINTQGICTKLLVIWIISQVISSDIIDMFKDI